MIFLNRKKADNRKRYGSLASRVLYATVLSALLPGVITLLVGLSLYRNALFHQYVNDAAGLCRSIASYLESITDIGDMSKQIYDTYLSLSEEERHQLGTSEYREHFIQFADSADHQTCLSVLSQYCTVGSVTYLYIATFDLDRESIVYIADPDTDPALYEGPGDWEYVDRAGIEMFLAWDGEGEIYADDDTEAYGWLCTTGAPIQDETGSIVGFVLADVTLKNITEGMKSFTAWFSAVLIAIMLLTVYFMTVRTKKEMIAPLNAMSKAAEAFIKDKKSGNAIVGRFEGLNIHTGDEIEKLGSAMANMEQEISEYERTLTTVIAENERIGTELELARRIQSDMLPNIFPPYPERTDFNIFASMDPAKEVGGDFYDFFLLDSDHLGLVMADVSGKGVPAALFMMISRILVRNYAMAGGSPQDVLDKVNKQIYENNPEEMFITVWLGILDLKTGHLTAANAGHEYPILQQANGRFELIKDRHGFVVGGMENVRYTNYELLLEKGAKLFVYTDGVPEATNIDGSFFGTERLLDALNQTVKATPEQIIGQVRMEVNRFGNGAPQFDDITMLCLEYFGPENPVKEITVQSTIDNIPVVTDFINIELESIGVPAKTQIQINIAIDEIFGNIVHYAYGGGVGKAKVRFEAAENMIILTFIDRGITYNPLEAPEPDITLSVEERRVGGLGIFLVRKMMDEVDYEHVDGCNLLRIKKYYQ